MNKLYLNLCLIILLAFIVSCTPARQIVYDHPVASSTASPEAPTSYYALDVQTFSQTQTQTLVAHEETEPPLSSQAQREPIDLYSSRNGGTLQVEILISIYKSIEELKTLMEMTLERLDETAPQAPRMKPSPPTVSRSAHVPQPETQTNTENHALDDQNTTGLNHAAKEELRAFMDDMIEEALADYPAGEQPREPTIAFDDYPKELVPVVISADHYVILDEFVLLQWEYCLRAGQYQSADLPKWIIHGLEQLTHTDKEDPLRLDHLMPLYQHMEASGYLQNIDVKAMKPFEVVTVLRRFVNDMKQSQGKLAPS
jgi:hypothetical protein